MAINFNDIAATPAASIERPPLLPQGVYVARVKKVPEDREVGDKGWKRIAIMCEIIEAYNGVDPEELAAFGKVKGFPIRKEFLYDSNGTEQDANKLRFDLRVFYEQHCGMGVGDQSLAELWQEAIGAEFLAHIEWRLDDRTKDLPDDEKLFYAEMKRSAPRDTD